MSDDERLAAHDWQPTTSTERLDIVTEIIVHHEPRYESGAAVDWLDHFVCNAPDCVFATPADDDVDHRRLFSEHVADMIIAEELVASATYTPTRTANGNRYTTERGRSMRLTFTNDETLAKRGADLAWEQFRRLPGVNRDQYSLVLATADALVAAGWRPDLDDLKAQIEAMNADADSRRGTDRKAVTLDDLDGFHTYTGDQ